MGRGRSQTRRAAKVAKAPPVAPEESASSLVSDVEAEAEQVDEVREAVSRGGPRDPGSGGKGRSRREREQNTNWPVPAGHERKISSKIRATLAKRRRRQQRTGGTRARGPAKAKAAETTDG